MMGIVRRKIKCRAMRTRLNRGRENLQLGGGGEMHFRKRRRGGGGRVGGFACRRRRKLLAKTKIQPALSTVLCNCACRQTKTQAFSQFESVGAAQALLPKILAYHAVQHHAAVAGHSVTLHSTCEAGHMRRVLPTEVSSPGIIDTGALTDLHKFKLVV
jgi:hypothetical protein